MADPIRKDNAQLLGEIAADLGTRRCGGFGIFLDDHDPKREQDIMGISHHH